MMNTVTTQRIVRSLLTHRTLSFYTGADNLRDHAARVNHRREIEARRLAKQQAETERFTRQNAPTERFTAQTAPTVRMAHV